MRKRTKSDKPSLFEKATNRVGWAWYSLKVKVASLFPKREKTARLGAKRRKDAFFVYGMLLLPLIQFGISRVLMSKTEPMPNRIEIAANCTTEPIISR